MTRAEIRRQQKAREKLITLTQEALEQQLMQTRLKALEDARSDYSVKAYKLCIGLTIFMIHDHFSDLWRLKVDGKSREERAFEIMMGYWQDVQNGEYTLENVMQMLKEEVGVECYER